jgi:hypothetical protein
MRRVTWLDFHNFLIRRRKHFSQPFSAHEFSNARRTELHTAEPLVPEP